MSTYRENLAVKVFIVFVIILIFISIIFMIKDKSLNLIWAIPGFFYICWMVIGVWQQEISIKNENIIQSFGILHKKIKVIKLEDVTLIVKDGFLGLNIYRILTKTNNINDAISFMGIKDQENLINEIKKRAPDVKIDPSIKLQKIK